MPKDQGQWQGLHVHSARERADDTSSMNRPWGTITVHRAVHRPTPSTCPGSETSFRQQIHVAYSAYKHTMSR